MPCCNPATIEIVPISVGWLSRSPGSFCATLVALAALLTALAAPVSATEPVQLTRDGRLKFSPVVSHDGREIVYVELADPTIYRLTRLNLADGSTKPLHPDARTSEFEPAFSADGKIYAYLKTSGVLRVNLIIQEVGGATLGDVPPADGFSGMRSPAIAPDRKHVVYSFHDGGHQQLFEVDITGKARRALTTSRGINNWPAYSPDGAEVVFGSSRDGDFEIYRMPASGGDAQRLTFSPGQDIRPRFSPDGKQIAFTTHRDGNAEVYVMQSDGSSPRRLTTSPDRDDYPAWYPDGKRLVIVSEQGGRHDLYSISVE
ncbi:MAG: PD40 domain-containing protein [Planctomycetia bacterium]|nr:PD40 domain-containing protein [Planctomycetia bacterium]